MTEPLARSYVLELWNALALCICYVSILLRMQFFIATHGRFARDDKRLFCI
jgi:hypothetical protein